MSLRLTDTFTGEKRPFEPLQEGKVNMYVCGVTPYSRSHLGHARCYVVWDLVFRYLQYAGYEVTYVRNFTDVDDKIIKRANERGISPMALAQENIELFYEDMDALGIARPHHEPRVSESIDEIIALIQRIEANGLAYAVDGDVYYSVESFAAYGKLSGRTLDDMRAGERVEINTAKRNPMDFALWKAAKPGEPKWASPWGEGRPGWHIECSAMSMKQFGETFDIHGGGRDLVFPHHENEIAQSEAASGKKYVNYWMHNGFINIDSEKMSKSLGNVFNIADVLVRYEPQVMRYFFISGSHYRSPMNFSDAMLDEAAAKVAYFYETLRKVEDLLDEPLDPFEGPVPKAEFIESYDAQIREAMDDDFNAVRAMGPMNEAFKLLNEFTATKKKKRRPAAAAGAAALVAALKKADVIFNLFAEDPARYLERHSLKACARHGVEPAWIETRIADRVAARVGRDWAEADVIRDELLKAGVVIMDRPEGTDWMVDDVKLVEGSEA